MLNELINYLNEAMSAIQSLQLQPTEHNCSKIMTALSAIRKSAEIGVQMDKARAEPKEPENVVEINPEGKEDDDGI